MRRFHRLPLLGLLLAFGLPAQATPIFARAYKFSCQTCHNGFPRLNSFGMLFKANNFRIPGNEKYAPLAWQKTVPLAVQVVPTYEVSNPHSIVTQFTDTQLLAGGLLSPTTAFYLHDSIWIDATPIGFPTYEVWVQQVLNERNKVMLKAGQFELPYAYSPLTHLATVSQPLLFGAGLGSNDVVLGSAMRGLQLSGILGKQARLYAAAGAPSVLAPGNTVGRQEFFGEFPDFFIRVSTADLDRQVGFFTYLTHAPRDPTKPQTGDNGQRYGLEGALLWRRFQFNAMAVYGENNNPTGKGTKGILRSGFVEVNRYLLPKLDLTARLEAQTTYFDGVSHYADAKVLSLRFYPWQHLKLEAEYQQADHGVSTTSILAAFAF